MSNGFILWADDEIELLKAHILFLQKKGYEVTTVSNGADAIEECRKRTFDLIMLDEMMPGLTGLETLQQVKDIQPQTPVVMVTKSEEEDIMDQAIGSKIADYLIKPVNPSQILLTLKEEADNGFAKYVKNHYMNWMETFNVKPAMAFGKQKENPAESRPTMSPDIFKEKIFPAISNGEKVFLIVIDNFRWDQWRTLSQEIGEQFDIDEDMYVSILPTATQYARNAIFSGLMPNKIASMFPELWVDEDEEEGKNLNEEPLIRTQIERFRRHDKFSYHKINDSAAGEKLLQQYNSLHDNDLNVVVINFIDMLSHARTESKMVRELANNESAYRSITQSWFRHSVMSDLFKRLAESDYHVILTTDHGSIRCSRPVKIVGDRNTNTNLRYKLGKNLNYDSKEPFAIREPQKAWLPAPNVSTSYVFASGNSFFAYPNNYNYYVSYYKDTFQHGGISMEEMLIPLISLKPRKRG